MRGPPDHDKHRDNLSSITVHELRASLTVINAQAQMVDRWLRRTNVPEGERALERLAMIEAMASRMAERIAQLQDKETPGPSE